MGYCQVPFVASVPFVPSIGCVNLHRTINFTLNNPSYRSVCCWLCARTRRGRVPIDQCFLHQVHDIKGQVTMTGFPRSAVLVLMLVSMLVSMLPSSVSLAADELPTRGAVDPRLASFDRLMVSFLQENELPGAALAIGRNGKLIYSRGYGFADLESKQPVEPQSLFRIASISKPVTATAVMRLVQEKKLRLDDRAFALLKLEPHLAPGRTVDPRLETITIQQLLQHTAGWDRDKSFDPMFRSVQIANDLKIPPPAMPRDVIRYMLTQPLDFNPGERYAYSNFGYCVLGRVIEAVTKQTYEDYVRSSVLKPLGISTMQIGQTRIAGRAKSEVTYVAKKNPTGPSVFAEDVGQPVPQPYGAWCLEAMDAHGGWIASAPDLVKFAMQFDAPQGRQLLSPVTLSQMFARPEGRAGHDESGQPSPFYYSCGWLLRPIDNTNRFNIWHNGSLPGTSTLLVRRHDNGLCWAVLINSRDTDPAPSNQLDPKLHVAAREVVQWPN